MEFRQKISLSREQLETRMRPRLHIILHSQSEPEIRAALEEIADLIHGKIESPNNYTDETRLTACKVLLTAEFSRLLPMLSMETVSGVGYPLIHLAADEPTGEIGFLIYKMYPELHMYEGPDGLTPTVLQILLARSPKVASDIIENDVGLLYLKVPFFDQFARATIYEASVADIIVNQIGSISLDREWVDPIRKILEERKFALTQAGLMRLIINLGIQKEIAIASFWPLNTPEVIKELEDFQNMARVTAIEMLKRK